MADFRGRIKLVEMAMVITATAMFASVKISMTNKDNLNTNKSGSEDKLQDFK